MLLWLIFAVTTAAVLVAVLAPLARPAVPVSSAAGSLAVYRDQLDEVESDRSRGLIDAGEAEAAKIEISRRLLASAEPPRGVGAVRTRPDRPHTHAALAAAVLVPLVTLALYLSFGSPGMPAFPASARNEVPPDRAGVAELVARVEARLREHPEEGEGWRAIAPVYFKLGRYGDAANAYARAMQLKGDSLELLEGFVDAGMLASDGVVTEEVRRACEKILALDPARQEARFWLALAKEQDGKLADALSDYRSLLTKAPADAPWRAALGERIDDVTRRLTPGSKPADPGPTTADVAAAQSLSAEERGRMIAGMVDGLAQRLKQNGRDLSGWRRLVNAYVVLDRRDDARQALAEARRNFAGDEGALSELAALAARLGLGS